MEPLKFGRVSIRSFWSGWVLMLLAHVLVAGHFGHGLLQNGAHGGKYTGQEPSLCAHYGFALQPTTALGSIVPAWAGPLTTPAKDRITLLHGLMAAHGGEAIDALRMEEHYERMASNAILKWALLYPFHFFW